MIYSHLFSFILGSILQLVLPLTLPTRTFGQSIQKEHVIAAAGNKKADELARLFDYLVNNNMFNGAVAVVDQGQLIFKRGYGTGNFETGSLFRANSQTEIASVSKQFTASAIMLLQERKLLALDDDINQYFKPELPYKGVKIRHLLSHTSGLPDYEDYFIANWKSGKLVYNKDIVEYLRKEKPARLAEPGTVYHYSNVAFILLAEIVHNVSGERLDKFLEKEIFKPAHMESTGFFKRKNIFSMPDYAPGVLWNKDQNRYVRPETMPGQEYVWFLSGRYGPGRLTSTVDDLLKWDSLLYSYTVLPEKLQEKMYTPAIKAADEVNTYYGFGWYIPLPDPVLGKTVWHSGDWPGNYTYIKRYLDKHSTVIMLNNTYSPYMRTIHKLMDDIIADRVWEYPAAP